MGASSEDLSPPPLRIAIIGGGIAGLGLAVGLVQNPRLHVRVYEAVPAYGDVGAGLALHANALAALGLLDPAALRAYRACAVPMGDEDRELATEVVLAQGRFAGTRVAELGRARGRATVARAHLLGADHPATPPRNRDGWVVYRTLVPADEARRHIADKWTRSVPILLGPRGHVNCIPLRKNTQLSAGVAVRGGAVASGPDAGPAPPLDPARYADYSDEAQQIVRLVARDPSASWRPLDHDHAPWYARGRVCVVGDAAHAALPFAGNGAAQALEDAAVLHRLFGAAPDEGVRTPAQIAAAFRAYDGARRPRSQAVVDLARKFGRVYAYAEDNMHEDPARMTAFFSEMAAFTNEFDVEKQNEDAMRRFRRLSAGGDLPGRDTG